VETHAGHGLNAKIAGKTLAANRGVFWPHKGNYEMMRNEGEYL